MFILLGDARKAFKRQLFIVNMVKKYSFIYDNYISVFSSIISNKVISISNNNNP